MACFTLATSSGDLVPVVSTCPPGNLPQAEWSGDVAVPIKGHRPYHPFITDLLACPDQRLIELLGPGMDRPALGPIDLRDDIADRRVRSLA